VDLDIDEFNACVDDPETLEVVNDDISDGRAYGVTGTPSFFVNGRLIAGAQQFDAFKTVIDEELDKAQVSN
jgi:protein-disulfide isomerase